MREVGIVLTMKRNIKYLRLSLEDDEVSGNLRDESNSVTNQRFLLDQYILSHPDVGTDFEEIIDDGFSGTSFQRPGMSRLLDLVEADQVDTILIKDLSRFGRNYLESGTPSGPDASATPAPSASSTKLHWKSWAGYASSRPTAVGTPMSVSCRRRGFRWRRFKPWPGIRRST